MENRVWCEWDRRHVLPKACVLEWERSVPFIHTRTPCMCTLPLFSPTPYQGKSKGMEWDVKEEGVSSWDGPTGKYHRTQRQTVESERRTESGDVHHGSPTSTPPGLLTFPRPSSVSSRPIGPYLLDYFLVLNPPSLPHTGLLPSLPVVPPVLLVQEYPPTLLPMTPGTEGVFYNSVNTSFDPSTS